VGAPETGLQPTQASSEPAPRKGFRRFLPIAIPLACVLAGSVLGAVLLPGVVSKFEKPEAPPEPSPVAAKQPANSGIPLAPIVITVNLAEERGRRYIKVGIVLEAKDSKAKTELENRGIETRDLLNSIMAEKRIQDIDTKEKKDLLRREIQLSINERLGLPDAVTRVYFDQFIIE
jgi:flagellar basal body-associated protein FliL